MSRRLRPNIPDRAVLCDDDPLRLDIAAALAFPDGSMSVASLRRERDRGRLTVERIGGKDYTTLRFIREMREKCRLAPSPRDCGSDPHNEIRRGALHTQPHGSSLTEIAVAAAKSQLEQIAKTKPKNASPPTLLKSTRHRRHR